MEAFPVDDFLPQDEESVHGSNGYQHEWDEAAEQPGLAAQMLSPRAAHTPRSVPQSPRVWATNGHLDNGLHRRHSAGTTKGPQLAFELRPLRITDDGELLKPDGMLSQDEDAALRRTIAALVLNLRGIDPDLRESGLDMLSSLARRRDCKDKIRQVAGEALLRLIKFLGPMYAAQGETLRTKAAAALTNLATDSDANAKAVAQLGGVDALLAVAGGGAEPVLAAAAMQALTALVGNADAKAMLLQHPSFLDGLLSSMHTDGDQHNARLECQLWLLGGLVQSSREAQNAALRCLPDLVHLLDAGLATSMVAAAAAALSSLVAQNERAQDAARNVGALQALLRLLHHATPETGDIPEQPPSVERAAWAIAELCLGNPGNKAAVVELHGVAPLVWLLDGAPTSMATTGAAAALCNLAEGSPENQAAICQAKALEKFPRLLQGGLTSSGLIIEAVAWCIQHLTESSPAARDTVRENGTLPLLVGILKSSTDALARERAAWAICNTATQNAENKAAFRKLGVLSYLVHILASKEENGLVAAALWALLQLAAEDPANQKAIATLGAVPHLLRLLESSNEVIAEGASETMLHIATPSDGNGTLHPSQSAVRAAGAIPSLLGVVAANPEKNTATLAVATLQNLAAESSANREAIREAGGIPILVSLIKAGPDSPAASVAVEALANLMAGSSLNREAVRLAGGVPVLVSLLDSGPWKDITERTTAAIAELVHTCPENQTLVVEEGGAKKLIALLKAGPNHPVTPHAARALQALACRHPSAQASILREQAVLALVKVLDGGPVSAGTAASVWALMEICMRNPAGQQELLQHEGLAKIVQLLSSGPHMAITAAAAWALYAATQGNRPVALAAYSSGALQPLLDLIQGGGSQAALEGALSALANIADLSSDAQQSAHRSGLLELLVGCLQQATNGKSTLRMAELAALALRALAAGNAPNQDTARGAGAAPLLVALLNPTQNRHMAEERKARKENAAAAAARAILALAEGNEAAKDAFVRSNAPTELVAAMVRSPERPVALHAATALHAVILGHADGQVALQECGGIQALINMLDMPRASQELIAAVVVVLHEVAVGSVDGCVLMLHGGIEMAAVMLLSSDGLLDAEQGERMAAIVQQICQTVPQAQAVFRDAGAVMALQDMLQLGPDHPSAGAAAKALLVLLYDYQRAPAWL